MISQESIGLSLQLLNERRSLLMKRDKLTESDFPMLATAIREMESEVKPRNAVTYRVILGPLSELVSVTHDNQVINTKAGCPKCPSHRFQVQYGRDSAACCGCVARYALVPA